MSVAPRVGHAAAERSGPAPRAAPARAGSVRAGDLEARASGLLDAVGSGLADELASHGLTHIEFDLCRRCLEGERTATQLARVLPADGARISRLVTGLVDRGLLSRRRPRSDRRVVMLALTREGRELTSRILESADDYAGMLTAGISDEELRVFTSVTTRIIANHTAVRGAG